MVGIFPGSITITDTGKRSTDASSVTEKHLVKNGEGIVLPDVDITFKMEMNMTNEPMPNKFVDNDQAKAFSWDKLDLISISFPNWTIQGTLDMTDSTDVTLFRRLCDLVRTKGYKTISGNWMTDNYTDYGTNVWQIFETLPTIRVRIKGFSAKNSANSPNMVDFSLDLIQDYEV